MVYQIKLLLTVLVVSAIAALCARAGFRDLLSPKQYRTAWKIIVAASVVAFMARLPSLFILGVGVVGYVCGRVLGGDYKARVAAFFLLLFVFPPLSLALGGVGDINSVLALTHVRMLSLVLLLPAAVELFFRRRGTEKNPFLVMDVLVYAYQILFVILSAGYLSYTGILRLLVTMFLEVVLPYYVMTRGIRSMADLRFVATYFALACIFMASIGVTESAIQRLIYAPLQGIYGQQWQASQGLMRGGMLRVQSVTPEPIILSFIMIAGIGTWAWLSDRQWRRPVNLAINVVFLVAMVSTWSRGPLLGLVLWAGSMIALRWCSARVYTIGLIGILIAGVIIKASGEDQVIFDALRALSGSTQQEFATIEYRRQLLDAALALIKQSPALGVANYMSYLQAFKQGEGIVDLVNTYLIVALNTGLIGLTLYIMPTILLIGRMLATLGRALPKTRVDTFLRSFISMNLACAFVAVTTSTYHVMPFVFLFLLAAPLCYMRYKGEVVADPSALPVAPVTERFAHLGVTRPW